MRNYPRHSFSIARISHPELPNHSPQPIGFTALDYLKRCRTFESRVRSFKPRTNLWSRNNFGECVEEARHLRDIPLICPIRRIPGEPRCHSPSGGSHEASESIHRNIYFTAEIADCLWPSVPAGDVPKTAAKLLEATFKARNLLLSPLQLLRGAISRSEKFFAENYSKMIMQRIRFETSRH